MICGYLHNFIDPAYVTPRLSLSQVGGAWDEVIVAFADVSTNGIVSISPGLIASQRSELINEITLLQARGTRVAFSIGGADAGLHLDDRSHANFVGSILDLLDELPFDGIDFNLESRCDLTNSVNARCIRDAVSKIAGERNVRVIFTPEWPAVQGGFIRHNGYWGSQLWILNELRDVIDSVRVQYYNNCDMATPYTKRDSSAGSAAQLVYGCRMLLEGFPIDSGGWFKGLKPHQIGLAVSASRQAVCSGYSDSDEVHSAVNSIRNLFTAADSSTNEIDVAVWSINWDAAEHARFSTQLTSGWHNGAELPPAD